MSFFEKGFCTQYLKNLEKLFQKSILNAKAILADSGDSEATGLNWIYSVTGKTSRPIYEMNIYCLTNGYNAVFCSRYSILVFKTQKSGICISHNNIPHKDLLEESDSS